MADMETVRHRDREVRCFGSATSLADVDICKLSFYLKCCIASYDKEKLDIDSDLLQYSCADTLPGASQFTILELATGKFNLDCVLYKTIFIDDDHFLLPDSFSNAFIAKEAVARYFPTRQIDSGKPESIPTNPKVMVCTTEFITEIYVKPVVCLREMFENVPRDFFGIARTRHCIHCLGCMGRCTCESGCPVALASRCTSVHRGVSCDGCNPKVHPASIFGALYHCTVCTNCNLCALCYTHGEHDQTHAFEKIDRPNATSQFLPARACPLTKQEDKDCELLCVPIAAAVPVQEATVSMVP